MSTIRYGRCCCISQNWARIPWATASTCSSQEQEDPQAEDLLLQGCVTPSSASHWSNTQLVVFLIRTTSVLSGISLSLLTHIQIQLFQTAFHDFSHPLVFGGERGILVVVGIKRERNVFQTDKDGSAYIAISVGPRTFTLGHWLHYPWHWYMLKVELLVWEWFCV